MTEGAAGAGEARVREVKFCSAVSLALNPFELGRLAVFRLRDQTR
jgi:hypothetical protein